MIVWARVADDLQKLQVKDPDCHVIRNSVVAVLLRVGKVSVTDQNCGVI